MDLDDHNFLSDLLNATSIPPDKAVIDNRLPETRNQPQPKLDNRSHVIINYPRTTPTTTSPSIQAIEDYIKPMYSGRSNEYLMSETSSNASSCSSGHWGVCSSSSGNNSPMACSGSPGTNSHRRSSGGLKHFSAGGLEPIPEYEVTEPPKTFQPLVPPPIVPKPPPAASYNISFPTTLQPRDRFDMWRNPGAPIESQMVQPASTSQSHHVVIASPSPQFSPNYTKVRERLTRKTKPVEFAWYHVRNPCANNSLLLIDDRIGV